MTETKQDAKCVYCKKPAVDVDEYAELMLHRPMPVCAKCADDLADEHGPWDEVL